MCKIIKFTKPADKETQQKILDIFNSNNLRALISLLSGVENYEIGNKTREDITNFFGPCTFEVVGNEVIITRQQPEIDRTYLEARISFS